MGAGPVTDSQKKPRPSWKLKPPHDRFTQGIVLSGFSKLPSAQALFLFFDWPENGPGDTKPAGKGASIQALRAVAPIRMQTKKIRVPPRSPLPGPGCRSSDFGGRARHVLAAVSRRECTRKTGLRRLGDR